MKNSSQSITQVISYNIFTPIISQGNGTSFTTEDSQKKKRERERGTFLPFSFGQSDQNTIVSIS